MTEIVTREEALQKAAKGLDISPSKYKQAMERFGSIKTYLQDGEYRGATDKPDVYLQGSFKLGTEIRPYKNSKDADYDIDVVCRLRHEKEITTPKEVKHQVGNRLKAHGTYVNMLDDEGKRCWTLNYAEQDGVGFHMDVLPSVKEETNSFHQWVHNAIAVTNKWGETGIYSWTTSNPKDFAGWFYDKNRLAFDSVKHYQKQMLFDNYRQYGLFSDQSEVPDIHVKTPLQRTIQLLKRHRDIRFCNQQSEKCKPISMVITVLAAQVYLNESTIYETLRNLIETLSRHADQMQPSFRFNEAIAQSFYPLITRKSDGGWDIPNPTNPGENFADRWHEEEDGVPHARAKAFFQWVAWAKEDFLNTAERLDKEHFTRSLVSLSNSKGMKLGQPKALSFNVAHRQQPHWPLGLSHSVQISARYKVNGSWQGFNSGDPLNKHLDLLFSANTNVPSPFQVYWQVVNTGKEAEDARQLRGEIVLSKTAGVGGLTQKESTSYIGIHWVECFIVKSNVCLARSGEFVVRIV